MKKPTDQGTRKFNTAAVRAGYVPDGQYGSINPPIYASSTFVQDGIGQLRGGFEYTRCGNPTVSHLEHALAELEQADYCKAFASGMAATDTLLRAILSPGDHLIIPSDAYGGTYRLVDEVFTKWGIEFSVVDIADLSAIAAAFRPNTRCIWLETPTNPLLTVADIAGVAKLVAKHNDTFPRGPETQLVVDNTFASPYLQNPLQLGADVVLHSTTKYLGGHSDVVGGAIVTNDAALDEYLEFLRGGAGATPSPFDAYLTIRGIKTLAVRMERHCDNAEQIAQYLQSRPEIATVLYPGLAEHPNHDVAARQMNRFGGMVSVYLAGDDEPTRARRAEQLCLLTKEFELAESLGGVESLIEVPAGMTHLSTESTAVALPRNLVRISVGIEDLADLIADLEQALDQL